MKHLDEHTLDLLAIKGGRAANHDREVEEHLAECSRCRQMLEKITAYYAEAEAEARKHVEDRNSNVRSVTRRRRTEPAPNFSVPRRFSPRYVEISFPSMWHRAGRYVSDHPVVSSFLAAALIGACFLLFSYINARRANISYYYYNRAGHRLEAYSASNKLLWSLPSFALPPDLKNDKRILTKMTTVTDLNGDGRNEIVTIVPIGNEAPRTNVKVIDSRASIVKTFTFGKMNVSYKGVHYDTPFGPTAIFKETMPDGKPNLFVIANNRRSPNVLARLDGNLKIIGEYWHYGAMGAYPIRGFDGSTRELILTGCHDVDDMQGKGYDFMAILDPSRLIGDGESSATQGFGFKPSPAEQYYIRFPLTDMGEATNQRLHALPLGWPSDSVIYVALQTDFPITSTRFFGFTYVFNRRNMSVREVKFIMHTPRTYGMLKREGKVHGTFDEQYLDNLKNGVRYWNGKEWVKRAAKVNHE